MNTKSWWAQTVHNKLIALVLAMVVLVPLAAVPASSSMRGLAALTFEGLGVVLLATLLWRLDWNLNRAKIREFFTTGANLPILLFLGLAIVSCVFSPHKQYSEQELLRVGTGILLYFAVAYEFRRSEQLARMGDAIMAVAIGVSVLSFAQFASSHSLQAAGVFGDHQLLGSFLMILLPLTGIMAVAEKNPNRQLAAQIATVMAATCLLLAQARSAWIGAAAGLAALGIAASVIAWRDKQSRRNRHQAVLPIMLLVIAVGFFLLIFPQTSALVGRATTLQSGNLVSTWQIRQNTWRGVRQMIAARPLTGFGLGLYPYYQKDYTQEGMPIARMNGAPSLGEQAHNNYLQTAAELGLPGLLLMVAAPVMFLIAGFRRLGQLEPGMRRSLLMGSMGSVVAFAVDAYASPSWQCGQVSMFFWLIMGIGVASLRPQPRLRKELTQGVNIAALRMRSVESIPDTTPPAWLPRFARPAGVLAALTLILLLPTFALAVGDLYATPKSLAITPANSTIRGGGTKIFTVTVTYSNQETQDVTLDNGTGLGSDNVVITQSGGQGFMTGANNRIYQSKSRENNPNPGVKIMAVYTQNGNTSLGQKSGTLNASTQLFVSYP